MEQSDIEPRIILQAERAAKSALVQWYSGQWSRQAEKANDLTQELLFWYIEPRQRTTRAKMTNLSDPEVMVTFRRRARQLLSRETLDANVFDGKVLYSPEAVKDALKGESTNIYLKTILPLAMDRLTKRMKEALQARYFGEEVVYPDTQQGQNDLKRAHKSLCDEINVLYITDEVSSIGSRNVVFPDTIRPKGGYNDPTADTAMALIHGHPSYEDEYLYESPWDQVCKGNAAEPVIDFGPSGRYRLTAEEADLFRRVPGLIDLFIDQKQQEWKAK